MRLPDRSRTFSSDCVFIGGTATKRNLLSVCAAVIAPRFTRRGGRERPQPAQRPKYCQSTLQLCPVIQYCVSCTLYIRDNGQQENGNEIILCTYNAVEALGDITADTIPSRRNSLLLPRWVRSLPPMDRTTE